MQYKLVHFNYFTKSYFHQKCPLVGQFRCQRNLRLDELCQDGKVSVTTAKLTRFIDVFHLLILLCLGLIIAGPGYQSQLVYLEGYWAPLSTSLPSSCIIKHQRMWKIRIVQSVTQTPRKINYELLTRSALQTLLSYVRKIYSIFSILDWNYLATQANMESIFEFKCINLFLMIFPRISLHCKLVPVFQSSNMTYSYNSIAWAHDISFL